MNQSHLKFISCQPNFICKSQYPLSNSSLENHKCQALKDPSANLRHFAHLFDDHPSPWYIHITKRSKCGTSRKEQILSTHQTPQELRRQIITPLLSDCSSSYKQGHMTKGTRCQENRWTKHKLSCSPIQAPNSKLIEPIDTYETIAYTSPPPPFTHLPLKSET